jgi:hypothetical protein
MAVAVEVAWHERTQSFYARRNQNIAPPGEPWKNISIKMHREVLGLKRGDARRGEHRNGDTLDNRRSNLRPATDSQNAMNRRRIVANNTSGHKGVYFRPRSKSNQWGAFVKLHGKMIHLGFRATKEEAIALRLAGEKQYYGEFARE